MNQPGVGVRGIPETGISVCLEGVTADCKCKEVSETSREIFVRAGELKFTRVGNEGGLRSRGDSPKRPTSTEICHGYRLLQNAGGDSE